MTFLNSVFLLGLAAVSIPIIIHLLSQKKPRKIDFSDLRFLELAASRSVKKFRIRQYLLLLIRCLIILILTFIFARPVIHYISSSKNTETIFLIDNSYSMDYYRDGKTRLEHSKNVVKKILNLINPQDKIAAFSFSDTIMPVVKNPTVDKRLIISEIEKIKIEYKKTDVTNAVNDVIKYFLNDKIEKRIIIISDFAKNGWLLKKNTITENYKIICVDVGDSNPENFAVSDVVIDGNKLTAFISNYSDYKKNISMDLYVDGKKYKSTFLGTYPHKTFESSFDIKNIQNGIHKCFIEIEPDKLLPDNKYFFAFNYREKPKVLLIDGNPQFSDFKGETFFLKTALANYSDVRVINFSQFENEEISNYSVLFFCNVSDFNKDEVLMLKNHILDGKYLVFFLGDEVASEKYNTKISFLLPCEISSTLNDSKLSNYNLPENQEMSIDANIRKRFLLVPKYNAETLLKFTDDTSFLIKGKNNVFVFAVSANLSYSDIPVKPIFPVIIKQLFSCFLESDALIGSVNIGGKYAKKTEKIISEIVYPDGKIPKNQNEVLFEHAGVYEIRYKNHRTEYANVNLDVRSDESDLVKIDATEIKKLFDKMFVGMVTADEHFEKKIKKILYGNEITKYFILLLLVFAILETLLANYKKL